MSYRNSVYATVSFGNIFCDPDLRTIGLLTVISFICTCLLLSVTSFIKTFPFIQGI